MSIPYSAKKTASWIGLLLFSSLLLELVLGSQLCQQAGLLGQQALFRHGCDFSDSQLF